MYWRGSNCHPRSSNTARSFAACSAVSGLVWRVFGGGMREPITRRGTNTEAALCFRSLDISRGRCQRPHVMKTRALIGVILGICVGAGSLTAQTPAAPPARAHSLSLYASPGGTGGAAKSKSDLKINPGGTPLGGGWVTAEERHYSQNRQAEDMINLNVEIRNLAKVPDQAKLEWFFYARNVKGGDPRLFDSGSQDVNIEPTGTSKVELQSRSLVSRVERKLYTTDGIDAAGFNPSSASVNRSGERPAGWLVRISDGTKVLAVRGSSQSYETLGLTAAMPKPTPGPKPVMRK